MRLVRLTIPLHGLKDRPGGMNGLGKFAGLWRKALPIIAIDRAPPQANSGCNDRSEAIARAHVNSE
jgi:hypothetical protein